ncbi:MAG: TraB/GumN family protein [Sphingobium sp.]|nr:TraB/GumN family protein [Sphingobium sp.]
MKMLKPLLGATAALALLFAGPATAQTAPAPAAAAATVDADPALWVLKRGDATVYLFGTVHVLKPGLSWFDEEVKAAFDRSDRLILELPDVDEKASQPVVLKLATDTTGVPLTQKLPAADRAAYEKAMADLGIPTAAFDKFEPWFAAVNLGLIPLLKLGYDPNSGAEKTLLAAAKKDRKPVAGFESLEQQLGYFDTMPQRLQVKYLGETVKDLPKAGETIDKMVAQWAKGDPDALDKTLNEGLNAQPELAKLLLADRNKRWAVVIDDLLSRPGTTFVAVGAGHLAGKNSVQNQLKRYGITAKRVNY